MNYPDSNFIFALYKELSGIETDVSIYDHFFMGNKDVRFRFKEQHVWPKDDVWYKHLLKNYKLEDFTDFVHTHVSPELRQKFPSIGAKSNPDDVTLSSVIYVRFLLVAQEKWNNNFDLLKKIVLFYCRKYELTSERIAFLKKCSYADMICSLIVEASSTRGESRNLSQTSSEIQLLSVLLDTMDTAEWLSNYNDNQSHLNPLMLKLIASYHFLKDKLMRDCKPNNSKDTLERASHIADEMILIITDMPEIYIQYLPIVSSDKIKPLSKMMCIGDEQNPPAILGELYLRKAQLLLYLAKQEQEHTALLHIYHAKKYLLDAEETISQHLEIEKISLMIYSNQKSKIITSLLKTIYLYRVFLYCQLANTEKHPCRMVDLCNEYMEPCQKAFQKAAALSDECDAQYQQIQKVFQTTFFDHNSPVLKRVVCPENNVPDYDLETMKQYISCASISDPDTSWLKSFQFQKESNDTDLLLNTKTVFSADFDSFLSKNMEDSSQLELSIFQIVASGITIVLQLNQITDNIAMLKLLHNPAFQVLCRKGVIVLSCYGNILTPKQYLINALQKDRKDFEFSSSKWFNHPVYGTPFRTQMLQCLTGEITYAQMMAQLPNDIAVKNEMDFCYDSYRLLMELFTPSTIRQFHQNGKIRYPQRPLTSQNALSLIDTVDFRIQELREDDKYYPLAERQDFLDFCTMYQEEARERDLLQESPFTRSDYFAKIFPNDKLFKQLAPQNQSFWNWYKSLIIYSYCMSNGSRSSDHIYNTIAQDILRLHPEQSIHNHSVASNLIVKDAYTRYRQENLPSSQTANVMQLADLLDISMTVRKYNLERMNQDSRLARLEQNTGMKYDITKSGDSILSGYNYGAENGTATSVIFTKNSKNNTSGLKDGVEIQL